MFLSPDKFMDPIIEKDVAAFSRIAAVNMILETLQNLTGLRLSIVVRVDDNSWTACAVVDNLDFGLSPGDQLELSTTYCNTVRGNSAPLIVKHASKNDDFKDHPGFTVYGVESYIAVPLYRQNGECFGVMCALDLEPREFSEELIGTFELFANLITYELEAEERRQEGEELLKLTQQSNESRARFMSILGHDLRGPLSTIVMAATLQKQDSLTPEKNVVMAEKIIKTAKRMQFLIEDLLDTTQTVQGNEIFIDKKYLNLTTVFQQIIEEVKIIQPNRNIEFYAEEKCFGLWDEGRLGQVLSNLLSNALHYGSSNSIVKVNLIEDCEKVILQVNNQGEVMPDEIRKNLFTPFWRGAKKSAGSMNSSGLGLGLYIVKQIVEAHGGKIEVDSNREYGTTFTVIFENAGNDNLKNQN